jgi:3'-phosphoadenosine 5'-phosphosulfate sulfotransferase (PAPS reductase)/FAD synthetase
MSNIDIKLEEAQLLSEQKARMEMIISGKEKTYSEKVKYAKNKIREFYNYCKLNNLPKPVVSFSGGRDSSVLLYLVREMYPDTTAITATELFNPDNSKLIQKTSNICVFPPKMSFEQVIKEKGFPMISKELSQKINAVRNCKTNGK